MHGTPYGTRQSEVSALKTRTFRSILLTVVVLVVCAVFARVVLQRAKTPDTFRRYVLDPIPESVARIRARQPKTLGGYGFTFRFEIDRSDLAAILDSRSLERVHDLAYEGKVLSWYWTPSTSVSMSPYGYSWWPPEPKWFADLGRWKDPEAYALEQRRPDGRITEVLIYNPELREAIFLTWLAR